MAINAFASGLTTSSTINCGTNALTCGNITSKNSLGYTFQSNYGGGFASVAQAGLIISLTIPNTQPFMAVAFVNSDSSNGPSGVVLFSSPAAATYTAKIIVNNGNYLSLSGASSVTFSGTALQGIYNGYTGFGNTANVIVSILQIA